MSAMIAVIQLALVPILVALAFAVRFAGKSKPLNVVDYGRVTDPVGLHRWVGNRLFILPADFLIGGLASLQFPAFALLILGGATVACLCVVVWLALAAETFQSPA